ncbi:MAG: cytochrome c biogenesis protein ResB, partial [Microbacteriaceae bacterium]
LMLALAAVPGSLFPQRSADPNGVIVYYRENPETAKILDAFQLFDVFSSVWFSSIYVLLFISLIGCILPRTKHHFNALRAEPPKTPVRLTRLPGYQLRELGADSANTSVDAEIARAVKLLKAKRYRIRFLDEKNGRSVSAERGYLRETGNLIFHSALVGVLAAVGIGGAFGYSGQRLLVEGQTFANTLSAYDSFTPGRFFSESHLVPYALTLDYLDVVYESENKAAIGLAMDYTASVTSRYIGQEAKEDSVKVNWPLHMGGTDIYLLGNGYAPTLTVRNADGQIVWSDSVPFLAQDQQMTSVGVIKIPDGLETQLGLRGFFYPSQTEGHDGAYTSFFPDLLNPVLTLNVYTGDLGLDEGIPRSVYVLDTENLTQISGRGTDVPGIELLPGETVDLPNGLGTISLDQHIPRFASFDIHHDPAQVWVLASALTAIAGLFLSLLIPRRRMWVRVSEEDDSIVVEYAGLARGEDPNLEKSIQEFVSEHSNFPDGTLS